MQRRVDENGYPHDDHDTEAIDKDLTIAALHDRVAELEARIGGAKEAIESAIASHGKNDLDGWELGVVLTRLTLPYPTTRIPKWVLGR